MRLTPDQLASLDALDWFPDGESAAWDDDALRVFTLISDYDRDDRARDWARYVHLISLTNPALTPSENFCRRAAMVLDGEMHFAEVTEEAADNLSTSEVARLFRKGLLARIDSLDLDNQTAYDIIKDLAYESTTRSVSLVSRMNAFFYRHEINPLHIEFFVSELQPRRSFDLEILMFLASHPLSSRDVLKIVAKVAIPQIEALYKRDSVGSLGNLTQGNDHISFSYISHHLKESKALGWLQRRKLYNFVGAENASTWVHHYVGEKIIFDLSKRYKAKFWWNNFHKPTPEFYSTQTPVDLAATVHGVGGVGVPPGIALYAATQFLVQIEKGGRLPDGAWVGQEAMPFWALPYMRAAKAWLMEEGDADNVPMEWLALMFGYDDNLSFEEWDVMPTSVTEHWAEIAQAQSMASTNS